MTYYCAKCAKEVEPVARPGVNLFECRIETIARHLRYCPFCGEEVEERP